MNILWILWCNNNNEVLKIKVNTTLLLTKGLMQVKNLKNGGRAVLKMKQYRLKGQAVSSCIMAEHGSSLQSNLMSDLEQGISFSEPSFPYL